jgi:hypothetical protein
MFATISTSVSARFLLREEALEDLDKCDEAEGDGSREGIRRDGVGAGVLFSIDCYGGADSLICSILESSEAVAGRTATAKGILG